MAGREHPRSVTLPLPLPPVLRINAKHHESPERCDGCLRPLWVYVSSEESTDMLVCGQIRWGTVVVCDSYSQLLCGDCAGACECGLRGEHTQIQSPRSATGAAKQVMDKAVENYNIVYSLGCPADCRGECVTELAAGRGWGADRSNIKSANKR